MLFSQQYVTLLYKISDRTTYIKYMDIRPFNK